jgi:2-hydroxychromene-2-carboxylate isomerase
MIQFYFDFLSPYAYLAWLQVPVLEARLNQPIVPVPALLAGLLNHHKNLGPAEVPAKRAYVFKHVSRIAHAMGEKISMPPSHPFNPLAALRIVEAAESQEQKKLIISHLFKATWKQGLSIETLEDLSRILLSLDVNVEALMLSANSKPIKERLKQNTQVAAEAGIFGVPTFSFNNEIFWGLDSIEHLINFTEGQDCLDACTVEKWKHLGASAGR